MCEESFVIIPKAEALCNTLDGIMPPPVSVTSGEDNGEVPVGGTVGCTVGCTMVGNHGVVPVGSTMGLDSGVYHGGEPVGCPMVGYPAHSPLSISKELFYKACDKGLAYTITYTDNNLAKYRQRYLIEYTYKMIRSSKGYKLCQLIPEYSETGRLHMHGVIKMGTTANHATLQRKLRKEFGIIKVKTMTDTNRWMEYCYKDKKCEVLSNWLLTLITEPPDEYTIYNYYKEQ